MKKQKNKWQMRENKKFQKIYTNVKKMNKKNKKLAKNR